MSATNTQSSKIERVFNNNVVLVADQAGQESIVLGAGLGFQKKSGDHLDASKIERKFVLQKNPVVDRLFSLLNETSPKYLEIAVQIVSRAEKQLAVHFRKAIYLTLMDHIAFAVSRTIENVDMPTSFFPEVSRLYQKEYQIGLWSLQLIKDETKVSLPIGEASNIALHLINGQMQDQSDITEAIQLTKYLKDIINIVQYSFNRPIDEKSLNFDRFMIHLRFFLQHLKNTQENSLEEPMIASALRLDIESKYPQSYVCANKIVQYLADVFTKNITDEEVLFLTIHIHRVTNRTAESY